MKTRISIPRLIAITLLSIAAAAQAATTITVTSGGDSGGGSLRQAISDAMSGDTINFAAAVTTIDLTTTELLINKSLTISGPGANLLSVQRSAAGGTPGFRIFDIPATFNVAISGLTIANGVVNGTANNHEGGGIFNGGTLTITNCTISGNSTQQNGPGNSGGGISNAGMLTITNSTISANTSSSNTDGGGGIHNTGTLLITNSTISGNSSDNSTPGGGGILNSAALTITNSTISGNAVRNSGLGGGGGILNTAGTATITNSTVTGNLAATGSGGGISRIGGTVAVGSTIIAVNTAPTAPDYNGTLASQGYNLIGNTSGTTITGTTTGNQLNVNPMLGPLQDNGGPTRTHALLSGSTAIEGGNSSGSNTDQRGFARPVDDPGLVNATGGDGSDIGAYEVQADLLPGCSNINRIVNNNNDGGTDSLRDVISKVCAGSTITFAPNVTGAIDLTSGELLINKNLTINGPGANLLSVQRSSAVGTPNFRIFHINGNFNDSISDLTIAKGFFPGNLGGGISNDNGTLTLKDVTVSGNTADIGAGIYTGRSATITNSTISGNTVSGNIAGDGGGGIYNQGGTLNLVNSTLSTNVAQTPGGGGQGGGIRNNLGTVSIVSTTIAGNSADQGGGIYHSNNGLVTLKSTIIALNTSPNGPDLNGVFSSDGFNLIGNSSGAMIMPAQFSDQIGSAGSPIDPLLGQLQDNGGPTFTCALLTGSRAIDKGNSSGSTIDQRGFARPVDNPAIPNATGGDGSDIGAFEVQAPTTLGNISTRLRVETGDNVLIGGFIITGTQPKKIIVRAIGPSLPLAGALADPVLELHGPGAFATITNDNWRSDQEAEIIATGIPPSNDLESAIVATLPANGSAYTAIVRGVNDGTGIGLVEVYDLDRTVDSKLANISTRGLVQTGDNVLIAGTIIVGPTPQKVIVRAIGPSLNLPGKLADPTLELRDGNGGLVRSNDNWRSDQEAEIIATGIPPTNDLESAIVETLPAGGAFYTAIVRGVNGTTGVAVVEVYALN